jgi:hypothetical protein
MNPDRRRVCTALQVESLEGKLLMSQMALERPHNEAAAVVAQRQLPKFSYPASGASAVMNAIFGGAGHEFVTLALKEVHNVVGIASQFEAGTRTQFTAPGLVFKTANWQSGYTGFPHDPQSLTVAGAILLKRKEIELGAIVRGPFVSYPGTTYVVFALNRGAGARLGPVFPERPGITPDALVTVTVRPYGINNSATLTDLTTGTTVPINVPIQVAGPVVRLLVPTSMLPSEGLPISKYRFAVYNQLVANGTYAQTGSFAPEDSMVPIGVETNIAPPVL